MRLQQSLPAQFHDHDSHDAELALKKETIQNSALDLMAQGHLSFLRVGTAEIVVC